MKRLNKIKQSTAGFVRGRCNYLASQTDELITETGKMFHKIEKNYETDETKALTMANEAKEQFEEFVKAYQSLDIAAGKMAKALDGLLNHLLEHKDYVEDPKGLIQQCSVYMSWALDRVRELTYYATISQVNSEFDDLHCRLALNLFKKECDESDLLGEKDFDDTLKKYNALINEANKVLDSKDYPDDIIERISKKGKALRDSVEKYEDDEFGVCVEPISIFTRVVEVLTSSKVESDENKKRESLGGFQINS